MSKDTTRRALLKRATQATLATATLGVVSLAQASSHGGGHDHHAHHTKDKAVEDRQPIFTMDSKTEGKCGTCRYWGGMRQLSSDGKTVYCHTLGWCNNKKSHHFQKTTTPETGPMASWKAWEAI
ncbi:hypothetical protein ACQZV8_01570 [Magnetococcales bacterium HHB-1]